MNIFGFLSVIAICIAACIITMILCKIGIKYTKCDNSDHSWLDTTLKLLNQNQSNKLVTTGDITKLEEELNKSAVSKNSMDAVIKACNEMMGITTTEVEDDKQD